MVVEVEDFGESGRIPVTVSRSSVVYFAYHKINCDFCLFCLTCRYFYMYEVCCSVIENNWHLFSNC